MNKMLFLISYRLKHQMQLFRLESRNPDERRHAMITLLGYGLAISMAVGYIIYLAIDLTGNDKGFFLIPILTSILFWGLGLWSILSGPESLFHYPDKEFVSTLPLSSKATPFINIISQYLVYLAITLITLIVGCLCNIKIFLEHPSFIFIVIILIPLVPLLSLCSTFLISFFLRYLLYIVNLRNNILISMLTLIIFMFFPIYVIFKMKTFDYALLFVKISPFQKVLPTAQYNINYLIMLILLMIVVLLLSAIYFIFTKESNLLTTIFKNYQSNNKPSFINLKNSSSRMLFIKELKLYSSSITYLTNTLLTPLALIVINILLILGVFDGLKDFSYNLPFSNINFEKLYLMVIYIMITLTTTTSSALSFEGKNIWIIQSTPISLLKIAVMKILLNILLFVPGISLSVFSYISIFGINNLQDIFWPLLMVISLIFISIIGYRINLMYLNFSWNSEMEIIKQSKSTILTAVFSMIFITIITIFVIINKWFLTLFIIFLLLIIIYKCLIDICERRIFSF